MNITQEELDKIVHTANKSGMGGKRIRIKYIEPKMATDSTGTIIVIELPPLAATGSDD